MASMNYQLFEQAMRLRKQIVCTYGGYRRELCPIVLGHSRGEEKALTYQFGGESKSGLPTGGEWRCLWLSKVSDARFRTGHGSPAQATPNRKVASRMLISTSIR